MRVLLVTTWDTACGIAEHSAYAKAAIEAADPSIQIEPFTDLDPYAALYQPLPSVLWLNYHAALHSRWDADRIRKFTDLEIPVLVTYHDTGVPNSDQCKSVCAAADYFVVHEPYDDLPAHGECLRQGVPESVGYLELDYSRHPPPTVGTVGFPFPWKNYDLLCEAAAVAGWSLILLAPLATDEQVARWTALHPTVSVTRRFLPRDEVLMTLAGCDATAFLYSCANGGTSGAIRQGIAARKPVLAFKACRQFRDLLLDPVGARAITWLEDGSVEGVATALSEVRLGKVDPGIVRLATQDSWTRVGQRYAEILRALQKRTEPARIVGHMPAGSEKGAS